MSDSSIRENPSMLEPFEQDLTVQGLFELASGNLDVFVLAHDVRKPQA